MNSICDPDDVDPVVKQVDKESGMSILPWEGLRKFRVARKEYENTKRDICSFYLIPEDEEPIPPYYAGQYLTFELQLPGEPRPIVRCHHLSDSPTLRDHYRVTIKRMDAPANAPKGTPPGLCSTYFHNMLEVGDSVEARTPDGRFFLDESSDRPIVLIAGGIGLTALVSMMNWLVASESRREVWFVYGVRNRDEHAMFELLERVAQDNSNIHLIVVYSRPTAACRKGTDYNVQGHVSVDLIKSLVPTAACDFYICGPPPMMDALTNGLEEWGVSPSDIHFEAFGPATVKKSKRPVETAGMGPLFAGGEEAASKNVQFTTYHPTSLFEGEWRTILSYVHLPEFLSDVEADRRRVLQDAGDDGRATQSLAKVSIQRGAEIVAVPRLDGCRFNPPRASVLWIEDLHRFEFRVQSHRQLPGFESGMAVNGTVEFYVGPVLVAETKIWAHLVDKDNLLEPSAQQPERSTTTNFQSVFVAHAHDDVPIIEVLEGAYRALGMNFLRDVHVLRSGERWNQALLDKIEEADIFQLCWSSAAQMSPYVEQEWRHALSLGRESFIRPCYWQRPMPDTPAELVEFHFQYLDLQVPGANALAAAPTSVTFARSGVTISWDSSCDSLLEFGELNGICIPSGCRAGRCGTCVTQILSGAVEYLAPPAIEPDPGFCNLCISVPKGNVEIDA